MLHEITEASNEYRYAKYDSYCMQTVDRGLGATAKDIIFL